MIPIPSLNDAKRFTDRPMELCLDFTNAVEGACHNYGGVMASVDGASPVALVISADGCRRGSLEGSGTSVDRPSVDRIQAWAISVFLTGRKTAEPIDDGRWDPEKRRMKFILRRKVRPSIF